MTNEDEVVVAAPTQFELSVTRDPVAVLAEAHRAAKALTDLVSKKKKPVMMNGEQYLEFEDWQTCGKFYNVTAKVVSSEFIELGGARGFTARAVVVNNLTGAEISAAEAMCLNDEDKWSSRAKYEYRDGVKTKVGEVPVPLFQLKSMAQTRACAKALRNVLAWVVVLAGYRTTPAEEITGSEAPKSEPIADPKSQSNGAHETTTFIPTAFSDKPTSTGKAKFAVKRADDTWFSTFSTSIGAILKDAYSKKEAVLVSYEQKGEYFNIKEAVFAPK